jgi:hypothetical protein
VDLTARGLKAKVESLAADLLARSGGRDKMGQGQRITKLNPNDPLHPFYPWLVLAGKGEQGTARQFTARRGELVKRLKEQPKAAEGQVLFADFRHKTYGNWFVTGEAFGAGPSRGGEVLLGPDVRRPVLQVVPPGLAHSGLVSGRLQGALRSPTFTIRKKHVLYHLGGTGVKVNLIIDGFQRIREPIYGGLTFTVNSGRHLVWHVQNVAMWVGHRAYVEIIDHNHGHAVVDQILFSDGGPPPAKANPLLVRMLDDPAVTSPAALARKYRALFLEIIGQWQTGKLATTADQRERIALLNWLLARPPAIPVESPAAQKKLAGLLKQCQRLEATLPEPQKVMAMADGTGENEHVFIRGSPKNLGPEVPRRLLEAIAGPDQPAPGRGSGRLDLARRMVHSSNPLLPRVLVNRLWLHHFGEGIVRSPDNFGVLGERPTHPELLDYLAGEFVRRGWSVKHMRRLMVLSSTYRMSSRADARADQLDSENKLLHRMPVRRLEAECIRDAMLAVSGRLDRKMYGPGVMPYLTSFMIGRGRPAVSGPLDGAGRRSLYINVRRNFLTPMFLAFDYPFPFTTIGRRSVSNVPAQALTMMNNPFVVEQAALWARRVLAEEGLSAPKRISRMYMTAFGRPPTAAELKEALAFLAEQAREYGRPDDPRAWADLGHVLMNVKEFIFLN